MWRHRINSTIRSTTISYPRYRSLFTSTRQIMNSTKGSNDVEGMVASDDVFVPPVPGADGAADPAPYIAGLKQLFTSKETSEQDKVVDKMYAQKAIFDDNIVYVSGHPNIKAQFHTLAKVFRSVEMTVDSTEWLTDKDGKTLKIINHQNYALGKRNIKLGVDTQLKIGEDGLVKHHIERWQGKWTSFWVLRWALGGTSSMFLRCFRV